MANSASADRVAAPETLQTVVCSWSHDVATLEMNRPARHNAMNELMAVEFGEAVAWAKRSGARAVLIVANGKSFCAGRDISDVDPEADDAADVLGRLVNPVIRAVQDLPMPVFAGVQGACLGAGLGIALACDVIYAADDARLGSPFSKLGAVLDSGAHVAMIRRLGPARTLDLIYSGRLLDGRAAAAIGLVERAVPRPLLRDAILKLAAQVAGGPTKAFSESKAIVRQITDACLSAEEGLDLELAAQARSSGTRDYREGFAAFLEKRTPTFTGR